MRIVSNEKVNFPRKSLELLLIAFLAACIRSVERDKVFSLKKGSEPLVYNADYAEEDRTNEFLIKFKDENMLMGENLFILLESENTDFYLNLWESENVLQTTQSKKVGTYSGNCLFVMSSGYFDGSLDYARAKGKLAFSVKYLGRVDDQKDKKFKLTISTGKDLTMDMGKTYTTMIDSTVNVLPVKLVYDGTKLTDVQKLRFQANAIRTKPQWQMTATLKGPSGTYQMNPIFKKAVGGILSKPTLPICEQEKCEYVLTLKSINVHMLNIETFFIGKIETISIDHYEDYYDRVYENNKLTIYKLPYTPDMENLDVSVSLIPVTGDTDLFININTLPNNLDAYDFKEEGALAKRITVRWKELELMQATQSDIFIAVRCSRPGEYLIKVDAHEQGIRGTLTPGVVEGGKVLFNEIANYIYIFEVIKTQEIHLDLKLNVSSGNADLFLKRCDGHSTCLVEAPDIDNPSASLAQIRDTNHEKNMQRNYTCEHKGPGSASICQFAVAILGKENIASHYELSLRNADFHRLMIPGHTMNVQLEPKVKTHFKFSFPKRHSAFSQLYLSVNTLWGKYNMYLSKMEPFPSKEINDMEKQFQLTTHNMYESMKTISMNGLNFTDRRVEGIYYLTFEAEKDSSFEIKFFEKSENQISIHTLTAGKQVKGELATTAEMLYYTINITLDQMQTNSMVLTLTPLKGTFVMLANRNGVLPTMNNKEFFSENNHLELSGLDKVKEKEEYIIGIALKGKGQPPNTTGTDPLPKFQFMLSLSYTNKPLKLSPGLFVKHTIKEANLYLIEILDNFNDLLVLKSVVDGYNIKLCAHFTTTEAKPYEQSSTTCDYAIADQEVSLYLTKKQLTKECQKVKDESKNYKPKCHLILSVDGFTNQGVQLGFTYNDHPFQLQKGHIIDGPFLASAKAKMHFVYHAEAKEEIGLYFNNKGRRMNIFTKLVKSDQFDDSMVVNFPNQANHDEDNVSRQGHIQNVIYTQAQVSDFGMHPELLVSIYPDEATTANSKVRFDGSTYFVLQTSNDVQEIMRTQSLSRDVQEDQWTYFSFYNNGNSDSLKIYVMSNVSAQLQVLVSQGLTSRPPLTNKPLIDRTGVGSLDILIKPNDLRTTSQQTSLSLRGHFVVAVKSSQSSSLTIYWNNKEDLNFLELTPNEPNSMLLEIEKKFFFSFYVQDSFGSKNADKRNDDRKDIKIYFKLNVRANIYVLKTLTGDLEIPGPTNYSWKTSTSDKGGLAFVEIPSSDPNYCVECRYIGFIEIDEPGELLMLVNVQHSGSPMRLTPGFTFPEYLPPHRNATFRLYNSDSNPIGVTVSMLSGFVNVYMSRTEDVSPTKYDEIYSLESGLANHKFIQVQPHKYGINSASEWFFYIDNPKMSESALTLCINKNNSKAPIEPGVTKFNHLGPGEGTDYFYKPLPDETEFEVRLELIQVMEKDFVEQALGIFGSFVTLYEINAQTGNQLALRAKSTNVTYNKLFVKFSIPRNSGKTFGIRTYNPVAGSAVSVKLDLLAGGYKLVNFNEYNLGVVRNKDTLIYEAYGAKDKFIFVDVRKCIGNPKISFYESDFQNVELDETIKYQKIKDENSFIQYVKLKQKRAFIKVENRKSNFTTFTLNVFNERDMDINPYQELSQDGDGQVDIETDTHTLRVRPLNLTRSVGAEFVNQVTYYAYLSPSLEIMRYAKNCGKYLISQAFEDPELHVFHQKIRIDHKMVRENKGKKVTKLDEFLKKGFIEIKFDGLERNKKYFGIVVAQIDLLPSDEGYISPIRSSKSYYDEFTIITPRLVLPVQLIVSCLVIVALLVALFNIIKAYIFEGISQVESIKKDDGSVSLDSIGVEPASGVRAFTMLERAYYEEKRRTEAERRVQAQRINEQKERELRDQEKATTDDHCQEIEMTDADDKSRPLELDA